MDNKGYILIGVLVLVLVFAGAGAYILLSDSTQYKNITMNDVIFEVPESEVGVTNQTDSFSVYNDSERGINILVFDSADTGFNDLSEAMTFAATREAFQVGAQLQQEGNMSYNYSDTLKVYSHVTNFTHKNVLIVTKSKEDMEHILSSMHVDPNSTSMNDTDNATDNTTVTAKKTSTKSSTSSDDSSDDKSSGESYADEDDLFVVNPNTGKREYGPAHPNYATEHDYLQEEHAARDSTY